MFYKHSEPDSTCKTGFKLQIKCRNSLWNLTFKQNGLLHAQFWLQATQAETILEFAKYHANWQIRHLRLIFRTVHIQIVCVYFDGICYGMVFLFRGQRNYTTLTVIRFGMIFLSFHHKTICRGHGYIICYNELRNLCHTERTWCTNRYLEAKTFKWTEWPLKSPNLNPIEHIWNVLKRQM